MSRPHRIGFFALSTALVVGLFFGYWYWKTADIRAVREMPEDERHALYLHVLDGVERYCWSPAVAPGGWCSEQARFLEQFPECEEHCAKIAGRLLAHATR